MDLIWYSLIYGMRLELYRQIKIANHNMVEMDERHTSAAGYVFCWCVGRRNEQVHITETRN